MTRLANMEKAGFFVCPPGVTHLIPTYITASHGGRILDPCAGGGVALLTLADELGLDPFGVELHEDRAHTARESINQLVAQNGGDAFSTCILHDSYLNLITSRGGYNLLYVNHRMITTMRTAV